jgi:hypothetical protein
MSRVIVMTELSKRLLRDAYGLPEEKIDVIPHGIPPMSFRPSARYKAALDLSGRTTLLTFGLLSRNKGIEYVIEALPRVVKAHPEAMYLVVGVTHPDIVRREGEAYRSELEQRVHDLGLDGHVLFYNEFVSPEELPKFLQAADAYVATSLDPNQSVSGTLSFARGSGRPLVSTAFARPRRSSRRTSASSCRSATRTRMPTRSSACSATRSSAPTWGARRISAPARRPGRTPRSPRAARMRRARHRSAVPRCRSRRSS